MSNEGIEDIAPDVKERLKQAVSKLENVGQMLQDFTKYTVALELFNKTKLALITQLTKDKVELITKNETYISTMKVLYDLDDEDDSIKVIKAMHESYRTNQISLKRQSRKEIVDILKDTYPEPAKTTTTKVLMGGGK